IHGDGTIGRVFCFIPDACILSIVEKWYVSGSIQKGRRLPGPFRWRALGNDMKFRGVGRLAQNDQIQSPANDGGGSKPAKRKRGEAARDASVGAALRSVYSQTVDEAVPNEFLDLLSKLD
ncbi:MAG: NepR family anti-sigma factor, partial [Rhizorhabdus sp.]